MENQIKPKRFIQNPGNLQPRRIRNCHVFWEAIKQTFFEYTETTKVNGMVYLQKNKTKGFLLRWIWIIFIISTLIFGAFLVSKLWRKFFEAPTLMTIDDPQLVSTVYFPAVTICHPQTVIEYKAKNFIEKIKIPSEYTSAMVLDALPCLGAFIDHKWSTQLNTKELKLINNVLVYNKLSVRDAVLELGMNCDDFLIRCSWAHNIMPCFDQDIDFSWHTSLSYLGYCCSFNYFRKNRTTSPLKAHTFGYGGGISVIGTGGPQLADGKSGITFSAGFMLLIHHPFDYPVEASQMTFVGVGQETLVSVYPTVTSCTEEVLALPEKARNCIVESDLNVNFYRKSDCSLACLRSTINDYCGCHPYYLPRSKSDDGRFQDCRVIDAECFDKNFYIFKQSHCSYCLPSCNDLSFRISSSALKFAYENFSINPLQVNYSLSKNNFMVHVYMANQNVQVQRRVIVMSFISFLANIGGVLNLCLGLSCISIFELIFYCFIKLRRNFKAQQQIQPLIWPKTNIQ